LTLVADTNVLIELFLPAANSESVELWWAAEPDWRLPSLWVCEFRHVHLKYLRNGSIRLGDALENLARAEDLFLPQTVVVSSSESLRLAHRAGCSSTDAEFVVLAQQLECPLLTFDQELL
jgi:predicted nucleic acid-binding protein